MAFSMVRSGDFYAIPRGDLHCGAIVADKPHRFTYSVRCERADLDSSGFIVDQLKIAALFEDIGEFYESCELLCSRLAGRIMDMETKLNSVTVSIGPSPQVLASCFHERKVSSWKLEGPSNRIQKMQGGFNAAA